LMFFFTAKHAKSAQRAQSLWRVARVCRSLEAPLRTLRLHGGLCGEKTTKAYQPIFKTKMPIPLPPLKPERNPYSKRIPKTTPSPQLLRQIRIQLHL
jgi:hypothetical protein